MREIQFVRPAMIAPPVPFVNLTDWSRQGREEVTYPASGRPHQRSQRLHRPDRHFPETKYANFKCLVLASDQTNKVKGESI